MNGFYCAMCGQYKDKSIMSKPAQGKRPYCNSCRVKFDKMMKKSERSRDAKRAYIVKHYGTDHLLPH